MTDGADPASLGGAAVGSVTGGVVGIYTPAILRPILGPSSGFWAETGSAFVSEVSGDATQKAINKAGDKK
ncbi:hypothetical protein [Klebsiella aerogenes]|uniref:hypothetical protein n=1 Tax=Klebsiella aerogenes TaxID=548 RepID=UPI00254EBB2D|nr:hypothetical protein [Klebsiella aerogenes]MDK7098745.1 hypothetical protein [Klebsiella aerogenes]MDK7643914.1 hypothetical protein [Klebsiella aerogenes]MDK7848777.1 hypothetical protein [Klebsiella aerogenes]MDK8311106.1 hypothetical protein [Klebsiella aerogenes]HEJ0314075.1 hypothetical protein [Klebsiella aerogenes]